MKKLSLFSISILSLLLFTSCLQTKYYINNVVKTSDIKNTESKSVLVTVTNNIEIDNFENTFDKNYESQELFIASYVNDFLAKGNSERLFANLNKDLDSKWSVLTRAYDPKTYAQKESLLASAKDQDYLIHFTNFKVSNRIDYMSSTDIGVSNVDEDSAEEYCVIKAKVIVYDVKSKTQILEFMTIGESNVFLLDFSGAFREAKSKSVQHAINFLKSGRRKYEI